VTGTARDAGLFVAGTDTGVGKTVVTAAIVARCRRDGVEAVGVKPVQTGAGDDAGVVRGACGAMAAADSDGEGSPEPSRCFQRLDPALAPRVAAERTGHTIDAGKIRQRIEGVIETEPATIVEGIGGLRVPITNDVEVIDVAEDLGLPCVVVARSDLGTLNHTLLTVDALADRGLTVDGVILNRYQGDSVAERTNPAELRRLLDVPVATLPAVAASDPATVAEELVPELPEWAIPPA